MECEEHELVPLRLIPGYVEACAGMKNKGQQQRCVWCNKHTSWACKTCTRGPQFLVPICPVRSVGRGKDHKGKVTEHPCCGFHSNNPTFFYKGGQGKATGKGAKRARSGA